MLAWVLKNPLTALLLAALLVIILWWRLIDAPAQYKAGANMMASKMMQEQAAAVQKQTAAVLTKERDAAQKLAIEQSKIERERNETSNTIHNLRDELRRVQQYAASNGNSARGMRKTTCTSGSPDDETATRGWKLFSESAKRYAELAEIADMQRNAVAEWQAYGNTIRDFNKQGN